MKINNGQINNLGSHDGECSEEIAQSGGLAGLGLPCGSQSRGSCRARRGQRRKAHSRRRRCRVKEPAGGVSGASKGRTRGSSAGMAEREGLGPEWDLGRGGGPTLRAGPVLTR